MDINFVIKLLILIVIVGLSIKAIKAISGFIFKLALISLILLFVYKLFI